MEWLDGEDLAERLASAGARRRRDASRSRARVAEALGAAHARGIVHRDIKPANLFLAERRARRASSSLDFGIARASQQAGRDSRSTGARRSARRATWRRSRRAARATSTRAPTCSRSAACSIECLTGAPAFAGDSRVAVLAKILLEERRAPRELRRGVPARARRRSSRGCSRRTRRAPGRRRRGGARRSPRSSAPASAAMPPTLRDGRPARRCVARAPIAQRCSWRRRRSALIAPCSRRRRVAAMAPTAARDRAARDRDGARRRGSSRSPTARSSSRARATPGARPIRRRARRAARSRCARRCRDAPLALATGRAPSVERARRSAT